MFIDDVGCRVLNDLHFDDVIHVLTRRRPRVRIALFSKTEHLLTFMGDIFAVHLEVNSKQLYIYFAAFANETQKEYKTKFVPRGTHDPFTRGRRVREDL